MTLQEFSSELAVGLKKEGFRKNRLTWIKDLGTIAIVFSVQKSVYCSDVWYYCFGVCLKPLCMTKTISMSSCQLQDRLEQTQGQYVWTVQDIASLVARWEDLYGTPEKLRKKALEGNLPKICASGAVQYLCSGNLSSSS